MLAIPSSAATKTLGRFTLLFAAGSSLASAAPMSLLVPAYSYPTTPNGATFWSQLNWAAGQGVAVTAILNPDSGPSTAADANYQKAISDFRAAGGKVIGYVHTRVAPGQPPLRSLSDVEGEVDKYLSFYGTSNLDGIFVDEMRNDSGAALDPGQPDYKVGNYYHDLYEHIVAGRPQYLVVGNPGTSGGDLETYLKTESKAADTLVTFEDYQGYDSATTPAWFTNYPASDFANIPYNVPQASLEQYIRLAHTRGTGYVYVTDDSGNPWDQIPTYWQQEVQLIKSINAEIVVPRVTFSKLPDQPASITFSGNPGSYNIETSTNLVVWSVVATVTTTSGNFTWTESAASPTNQLFYRVSQ